MTFSIVKEGEERNILNLHLARNLTKNEEGKYAFHCRRFAFGRQHFAAKYRLKEEKKGVFEWESQPQEHFVSVCHL